MLGCSACISGRQTSTRTGLDWDDAPVTGGGKGMGGRDQGAGGGRDQGGGGMEISIKTLPPISLLRFQPLPSPTTSTLTLPNLPLLSKTEEIFTACLPENTAALQAKMMHKTFK